MNKPQTLKGFRDFLPEDAIRRQTMISKMKTVFERFGFDPLETPALEYADVLLGKYGAEADKLLYLFEDNGGRKVGLRYDQTVPTARVMGQYPDLPQPFKRYQIQPVWRAENTQKGRYREFLQCDADIIGNTLAPIADAEILSVFWNIYQDIGFTKLKIVFNSRQVLKNMIFSAFPNFHPYNDYGNFLSIVRSIDKLSKIGEDGVKEELRKKEFAAKSIDDLFVTINQYKSFTTFEQIRTIDASLGDTYETATSYFDIPKDALVFDPTLARGLDYYTGIIFESVVDGYPGSLGGGGRYDNLIEQLGGPQTPAVGFAIGFDRTLEVAQELGISADKKTNSTLLVTNFSPETFTSTLARVTLLRKSGINAEMYLSADAKLEKQLKYADRKGIPYVIIQGPDEVARNVVKLKNLSTKEQEDISVDELINRFGADNCDDCDEACCQQYGSECENCNCGQCEK